MSTAAHTHRGRAPVANAELDRDPTRTLTLRRRYAQRLRGHLGRLNAVIREGVRSRDAFGLRAANQADPEDVPSFAFRTDDRKVEAFLRWLRRQERRGLLAEIARDDNRFVRAAYGRGLAHAAARLREAGVDVDLAAVETAFNLPVHRDTLQLLFTRNFQELRGITEAMNQQIARELTEGFAAGESPTAIARRITGRVDAVGKTRATVLARTEVVNAHAEATLNRFERLGVERVAGRVEFATAGDRRVCPICASLEGETRSIDEARGVIPVHPQCRCTWLPVV